MTTNNPTRYTVGKDLVEGVRSEGGLFYDVKIVATGEKFRILSEIFEKHAREVKDGNEKEEHSGPQEAQGRREPGVLR